MAAAEVVVELVVVVVMMWLCKVGVIGNMILKMLFSC